MIRLRDFTGRPLWVQLQIPPRTYELRGSSGVHAVLQWSAPAMATGVTADGWWTFERKGVFGRRVVAQAGASQGEAGVYTYEYDAVGTLRLPDGRAYRFVGGEGVGADWIWFAAGHSEILRVTGGGQVQMQEELRRFPELPLFALLGWFLLVLRTDDELR